MWWWIIVGIAALFVGGLALSAILEWIEENKTVDSAYGELIKQRLTNGNYRVVAGIFDKRGVRTATNAWETTNLDDDLQDYFGNRDWVRVQF